MGGRDRGERESKRRGREGGRERAREGERTDRMRSSMRCCSSSHISSMKSRKLSKSICLPTDRFSHSSTTYSRVPPQTDRQSFTRIWTIACTRQAICRINCVLQRERHGSPFA
jgi:hypothetical protein